MMGGCRRDADSLSRKGIEALNAGDSAKAVRLLEKAALKTEDPALAAHHWAAAGLAAARAGRGGDAEMFLTQSLALDPQLFEANYNLGDLLIQQNRLDEAKPYLTKAAGAQPGRTEALESLAGIALRQGDLASAVDYLNQSRNRDENVRVLTSLAVAGKNQFAVEETRNLLQRAVTLDPEYAPAQLNLAALLDQNRLDPAQAQAHYEAFLRLQPEDDKVPLVRQRMQIMEARSASGELSRPDPLRKEVEDLLASASQAANAGDAAAVMQYCLRANAVATRAQRSDLRERALRAATTLAPDSARAHFGLGQFMLGQGRKTEALVSLEKAHALAPAWPMGLRPTVMLAAEMSQKTMAQQLLTSSEAAGAANADFLLEIGDLYAEALNLDKEAKRVYRGILDAFPDSSSAREAQTRLDR
jgi:tetratricopeptide (TPR) repeat protein